MGLGDGLFSNGISAVMVGLVFMIILIGLGISAALTISQGSGGGSTSDYWSLNSNQLSPKNSSNQINATNGLSFTNNNYVNYLYPSNSDVNLYMPNSSGTLATTSDLNNLDLNGYVPYLETTVKGSGQYYGPNIYTDPSLESWVTALSPIDWLGPQGDNIPPNPRYISRSSDAHSGSFALQGLGDDSNKFNNAILQGYQSDPDANYSLSLWAKKTSMSSANLHALILGKDLSGNQVFYNFTGPNAGNYSMGLINSDLNNGNFEDWNDAHTPTNWNLFTTGDGTPEFDIETTKIHSGTYALKIVADGTTAGGLENSSTNNVNHEEGVYVGYWAAGYAGGETSTIFIVSQDDNQIWDFNMKQWKAFAGGQPDENSLHTSILTTSYQEIIESLHGPDPDARISIGIVGDMNGGTEYIDDAFIGYDNGPSSDQIWTQGLTNSYSQYSLNIKSSPDGFVVAYSTGDQNTDVELLDDISLIKSGDSNNIVLNPGFENWNNEVSNPNTLSFYTAQKLNNNEQSLFIADTNYPHSGTYDAEIKTTQDSTYMFYQPQTLTPGDIYRTSIWSRNYYGLANGYISIFNNVQPTATEIYNFNTHVWDSYSQGIPGSGEAYTLNLSQTYQEFTTPNFSVPSNGQVFVGYYTDSLQNQTVDYVYFDDLNLNKYIDNTTSIDIYKLHNLSDFNDLTGNDSLFTLDFNGGHAFKISGSGDITTDFSNGLTFDNNVNVQTPVNLQNPIPLGYYQNTGVQRIAYVNDINLLDTNEVYLYTVPNGYSLMMPIDPILEYDNVNIYGYITVPKVNLGSGTWYDDYASQEQVSTTSVEQGTFQTIGLSGFSPFTYQFFTDLGLLTWDYNGYAPSGFTPTFLNGGSITQDYNVHPEPYYTSSVRIDATDNQSGAVLVDGVDNFTPGHRFQFSCMARAGDVPSGNEKLGFFYLNGDYSHATKIYDHTLQEWVPWDGNFPSYGERLEFYGLNDGFASWITYDINTAEAPDVADNGKFYVGIYGYGNAGDKIYIAHCAAYTDYPSNPARRIYTSGEVIKFKVTTPAIGFNNLTGSLSLFGILYNNCPNGCQIGP